MDIREPCCITSRLLPGVKCGNGEISIAYAHRPGDSGRTRYRWYVDIHNGPSVEDDDLQSGCQGGDLREGLESLLSFLGAMAESLDYRNRTGGHGEHCDLFPAIIGEWVSEHSDGIQTLALEVQETHDCIVE